MPIELLKSHRQDIKNLVGYRPLPQLLSTRQKSGSPSMMDCILSSLMTHYFNNESSEYMASTDGQKDLNDHLFARTDFDRKTIIPWINSLASIDGTLIFEVGCGTGSSTVALAEQGARVIGYDVNEAALKVAEDRLTAYELKAELRCASAVEMKPEELAKAKAVIFFASAEHMTLDEKLDSLKLVWTSLKSGALLIVVGTPNRLWWFDAHTAHLPFYHWLPDDLAIHYAKFSPRKNFAKSFEPPPTQDRLLNLTRFGRAISYHEFELALGDLRPLNVSSMNKWMRVNPFMLAKWAATERGFEKFLQRHGPKIDAAFYECWLRLAVRKP